jgi:hypothetical protein
MIDFQNRRAIVTEGFDALMTFTTVHDLAAVVARAVDYHGEWPVVGGISGNRVSVSQILGIGKKVRGLYHAIRIRKIPSCTHGCTGHPFVVDEVKLEDLEDGNLKTSWSLETSHSSVSGDDARIMLKAVLIGTLLSSAKGAWNVSNEFNHLFPDYKFTEIEEFLNKVWR